MKESPKASAARAASASQPEQSALELSDGKAPYDESEIYSEEAVWLCKNKKTGYKTRIHGALAQILQKYPNDYKLRLLFIKESQHEHPPATDQ